jgi:hypothetical protein
MHKKTVCRRMCDEYGQSHGETKSSSHLVAEMPYRFVFDCRFRQLKVNVSLEFH